MANRKTLLNTLNKQKNRLKKRGATNEEISNYFGVDVNRGFGSLSDNELKRARVTQQSRGTVEINEGKIYPKGYIDKHDTAIGNGNYSINFNKRFKSTLNKESLSAIRKKEKAFFNKTKNNYMKELKRFGVSDEQLKRIKNMSRSDFDKMIKDSGGLLDYSTVFQYSDIDLTDSDEDNTIQTNTTAIRKRLNELF